MMRLTILCCNQLNSINTDAGTGIGSSTAPHHDVLIQQFFAFAAAKDRQIFALSVLDPATRTPNANRRPGMVSDDIQPALSSSPTPLLLLELHDSMGIRYFTAAQPGDLTLSGFTTSDAALRWRFEEVMWNDNYVKQHFTVLVAQREYTCEVHGDQFEVRIMRRRG
ncbi:hypothetical protein BAUCODRAFT_545831 [Baudoinia panamericana UAMH 10762]|uniref:Uncharacterized protein n=1 Tax=Baudoinia panamericana (strain UAMH 10762) TaxID=717646 RepID=M2N6G1_BAUPA|nr:uncharacterized protein BAUCODRAFT_545831 [Baudoinia panamericana UAMH 10762]EMC94365.1 hypothetical protein BAUCODRAFT_545831 [Baudoinia panamericana UAMH 10762]